MAQDGWHEVDVLGFPKCGGVYAVYVEGSLAYIGSSRNIHRRMATHGVRLGYSHGTTLTPWGCGSVRFKVWVSRSYADWLTREARLIRRLCPPHNRIGSRA